jgi:hypothetical protein|tara:strand:+ start:1435 stop:1644 length:210 start_codon:yes stop_codon:yes gene_type:complete
MVPGYKIESMVFDRNEHIYLFHFEALNLISHYGMMGNDDRDKKRFEGACKGVWRVKYKKELENNSKKVL